MTGLTFDDGRATLHLEGGDRVAARCVVIATGADWMCGDEPLGSIELLDTRTGDVRTIETPAVCRFIGAAPRTEWLPGEIARDERGFVLTGTALGPSFRQAHGREPFLLETSRPGVFAAGDVRAGSIERVASAVGDGAMAVQFVHEFLEEIRGP